jgi:hypothetical protein
MDIKMVWLNGLKRYGYILTILDVFTRVVLCWRVGLNMRQEQVQAAWLGVIEDHLQPHNALAWDLNIEIRSDNGPQFCATQLREFLKENHFEQTFTHPYTPQENGHVESFHSIISPALKQETFHDLNDLTTWLESYYPFYNYDRIHGSILNMPPMTFWAQWNLGNIQRQVLDQKTKKVKFTLRIPRHELSKVKPVDIESQREVPAPTGRGSMPLPVGLTTGTPTMDVPDHETCGIMVTVGRSG